MSRHGGESWAYLWLVLVVAGIVLAVIEHHG